MSPDVSRTCWSPWRDTRPCSTYLDNAGSVGPNSPVGLRRRRGLNENLAREILELHTVTPAAGYSQDDVTSFAKILTGWSQEGAREPFGFVFRTQAHEPGPKTVMGRTFPEGQEGGVMALTWLARHEQTHRHLATKLVRHFVADDPPPAAVQRIFGVLRDTQGDLGAASRALVRLPEAWQTAAVQAALPAGLHDQRAARDRGTTRHGRARHGHRAVPRPILVEPAGADRLSRHRRGLGRAGDCWCAASNGPMASRAAVRGGMPADLVEAVLGPLCRPETLRATARAGSAREALTLVLTSPEFQRR